VAYFGALRDAGDLVPADGGAPKASAERTASTDGAPEEPTGRA
jgi:hypothetical protein